MDLTIRRATESDIPAMHEVRMSVVENRVADAARVQPEHYRGLLENDGRGWVATAGARLLGFAIADLRSRSVWALFVDREAEGRGIGRRLHEVMVEWLFQCGARAITLGTDAGTRAEPFYRTAGWQHIGAGARGEAQFEMTRARWISVREANGRAAALPTLQTERLSLRWLAAVTDLQSSEG
jgi:GNAT superfamily N-acetyltransferase